MIRTTLAARLILVALAALLFLPIAIMPLNDEDELRQFHNRKLAAWPTLSSFAGLPTDGVWTLHVRDVAAIDTGRLQAWSLRLSI